MKRIASILFFSLIISKVLSQDTIIKFNNDVIVARILEISPAEVKYKKFNFQDGPTYIENKSDISMIKFANGVKETFEKEKPKEATVSSGDYYTGSTANPSAKIGDHLLFYDYQYRHINQPQMQSILLKTKDREITNLINLSKDARRKEFIGFATIPFAVAAIGAAAYAVSNSEPGMGVLAGICLMGTITCPIISGVNRHKKVAYNSEAIILYNQRY